MYYFSLLLVLTISLKHLKNDNNEMLNHFWTLLFCIIQVTLFRALYRSYTTTFHGTYIVDNKEEIPEDKIGDKIPDNISIDTYVTWFISMTMDLF